MTDVPTEGARRGGDREILAGDSAPADGVVLDGASSVDLSLLTGESTPVRVQRGDAIAAGSVNLASVLRVRVEAAGEETRVGKLMRIVEEASRRRAAIVRLADRWGARLLWILLSLAALTLVLWWREGPAVAFDRAVALLIVTCPCGLGLATPLAMTIAIGRGARRGILIKGGDPLQSLARRDRGRTIVLDKTGTITSGRLGVVRWHGEHSARALVAALEAHSSHPTARALARDLADSDIARAAAESVVEFSGAGIEGVVDGRCVLAGTRLFLESRNVRIGAVFERAAGDAMSEGIPPVFVGVDAECVGVAALGDPVRPEAGGSDQEPSGRAGGAWRYSPAIVRGWCMPWPERSASKRAAAARGVTPEGKLSVIREMAARHTTVMVGDGVNDAGRARRRDGRPSRSGGARRRASRRRTSPCRVRGLVRSIELLDGARRTLRTIHWTIASSLVYNGVAASLAMTGMVTPLAAAFLMPASSLTVLGVVPAFGRVPFRRCGVSVLYIMLPAALLVAGAALVAFILAVRGGQYDDLDTPAYRMLPDDDAPPAGLSQGGAPERLCCDTQSGAGSGVWDDPEAAAAPPLSPAPVQAPVALGGQDSQRCWPRGGSGCAMVPGRGRTALARDLTVGRISRRAPPQVSFR